MTALAPLSMAYLMVGTAPAIRWLLVMFLSESRGTLKSTCYVEVRVSNALSSHQSCGVLTLINTRLPLRSQSVMDSLFERDILSIGDSRV